MPRSSCSLQHQSNHDTCRWQKRFSFGLMSSKRGYRTEQRNTCHTTKRYVCSRRELGLMPYIPNVYCTPSSIMTHMETTRACCRSVRCWIQMEILVDNKNMHSVCARIQRLNASWFSYEAPVALEEVQKSLLPSVPHRDGSEIL